MFATIYLLHGFLLILPTLTNLLMRSDEEVSLVGSTVRLNCSLEALNRTNYAPINITWCHNETSLVGVRPILDATSSVLVLRDVQFDDSGTYSCSLIEAQESARIDINVRLRPEPATALRCSSTNFDEANCTWTRGGQHSNLPTVDVVERRTYEQTSEWKVCTENLKGVSSMPSTCNQTTCYVVCRYQGMGASYRVITNLLGASYSVFSEEVHFNIDEETIPNPPSDIIVQNKSASSLLIIWTPDPGVNTEGKTNFVNYFVKYHWEGDEEWTEVKVKRKDIKNNAMVLSGLLHPYGLYHVKIKCSSRRNQSGQYSRVASGRTSEIAPVDAPGNFSCSSVFEKTGKRNIFLSWELLPNKFKRNGVIVDQIIEVRQMVHMKDSPDIWIVGPNETIYTLKDMELEEKYEIRIRVRNSVRKSGNYSLCSDLPIPTADFSSVSLIVACVGSTCLFAAVLWIGFKFYKKVMKDFPDFQLPPHLGNTNMYFSTRSPHRTMTREKEVYDELLSDKNLFVDLPPAEKTLLESPGVSPGPNCNVAFSGSFDIGNAPQRAVESFPPANDHKLNVPFSPSLPTDGDAHRHRHWSSDTCTSSLNSPISVGSGGSYFFLRESDSTSYCVLAKDGFSPVKENNLRDRELPGVGSSSSAAGLTPSCLDLENDSDEGVSILGLESKKESCKVGSPERVLYTRKRVLPSLTDPDVCQPRSLKAAADSPIKSRDAAGLFGVLDEVTEEQEVESLGTIQENEHDMTGKGGGEDDDEVKEAGGGLGLSGTSENVQDANEDDGTNCPPEDVQDANGDDAIHIPPESVQDANEGDGANIPPENVQDANGDDAIKIRSEKVQDASADDDIPSQNVQSSVDDDVDTAGGASTEILGESASLCHDDPPDVLLNYITVCKDDEGADEEDIEGDDAEREVTRETGEDEISLMMRSSSDETSLIEISSNHLYPGSSNGAYIDQAQLANMSPLSSPTRAINHHDFGDPGNDP